MSEPVYEFVPGTGWVAGAKPKGRRLKWSEFASHRFDHWVCTICGERPGNHGGYDFFCWDESKAQASDTVGLFVEPTYNEDTNA